MRKLIVAFILLNSWYVSAQEVSGIIYSKNTTAKYISITNTRTKAVKASDENGEFSIAAKLQDTLVFSSMLYTDQSIVLQEQHFNTTLVVDLTPEYNALNEVALSGKRRLNANTYSKNLNNQIKTHIENNKALYKPQPKEGANLLGALGLLVDLFRSKNKKESKEKTDFIPITYREYQTLFANNHPIFTELLLEHTLNISTELTPLFFDFCDAKELDSKLLKKENEFVLLDSLVRISRQFNAIIKDATLEFDATKKH